MITRPVYVGVGECECGQLDARLYHIPNTGLLMHPVCGKCLALRGFAVPEPRTANDVVDDVVDVDGKTEWKANVPPVSTLRLELGHGHYFEAVIDDREQLIGWLHTHPDARNAEGMLCQSFCAVRPLNGSPVHQIICVDPLTLSPSLKCRMCGAHGEVTNGKWEPR